MYDVLNNLDANYIQCGDDIGFVGLIDIMPRLVPEDQKTADYAVVQMARVSYGNGTKTVNEDRGLIRYLLRHKHSTPFEGVEFKFHCKMPIFVARQWIRHRTANVNEVSGRYSILKDEFYFPTSDDVRAQSKTNKQGSELPVDATTGTDFVNYLTALCETSYSNYKEYLDAGIGKEQARMCLPLNLYTEWYWKIDLHNLLHFLGLRCDAHAQKEIRIFSEAMLSLITPLVPWCIEAFNDYHPMRNAVLLTALEVEGLRSMLKESDGAWYSPVVISDNKREQAEWEAKWAKLRGQV